MKLSKKAPLLVSFLIVGTNCLTYCTNWKSTRVSWIRVSDDSVHGWLFPLLRVWSKVQHYGWKAMVEQSLSMAIKKKNGLERAWDMNRWEATQSYPPVYRHNHPKLCSSKNLSSQLGWQLRSVFIVLFLYSLSHTHQNVVQTIISSINNC